MNTDRTSTASDVTTDVIKDLNMNPTLPVDGLSELGKPVLRNSIVKYDQYRNRPNSWSLVDRSSFYCSDSDFI